MEPRREEGPWLLFVVGAVSLFFGFTAYESGRSPLLWLAGGAWAILYSVADYSQTRWRAVAITLRVAVLLSFVATAVLSVVQVLS